MNDEPQNEPQNEPQGGLLPRDALTGQQVSLSVSDSPDLARLGLLEEHFRLALGEIARTVLTAGGTLAYGGHLKPEGYTAFLLTELGRWQERRDAITVYLPWSVHRAEPLADLNDFDLLAGPVGATVYLDVDGQRLEDYLSTRPDEGLTIEPDDVARGLTAMREVVTRETSVRVLLGGRRAGFTGRYPGLAEEALISLRAGQPVFLAGGFGGVTHDIATALGIDDGDWLPPWPGRPDPDPRLDASLQALREVASDGWPGLRNGLTPRENRRLAATHRPSEIAGLVGLGLGRIADGRPSPTDP
jgi:hypothetical protein